MVKPLVSVCIITYNHGKFIVQAIEGVLMQQVNFDYEIIIADDCSTDATTDIIKTYQKKYPDKIKLILQKANVGPYQNWVDLLAAPVGKYIAYFEGDDYWIDALKLQKQVDFLEANNDFNICFHSVKVLDNNFLRDDWITKVPKEISDINDLIEHGNFIHTPSVVFRSANLVLPPSFSYSPIGDYFLYILLTQDGGKIKFIDEKMAVYRYGVGIHSTSTSEKKYRDWSIMLYLLSLSVKKEYEQKFKNKYAASIHNIKYLNYHEAAANLSVLHSFISLQKILKLIIYKLKRKARDFFLETKYS